MKHLKTLITSASLMTALVLCPQASADVGYTEMTLTPAHRNESMPVSIWYPADDGGTAVLVGQNPVFIGDPAQRDARVTLGAHPLVLLSHGAAGIPYNLSWLSNALVEAGYVVAAPKHPGSSFANYAFPAVLDLRARRADLIRLLDVMLDGVGAIRIDPTDITVAGFSLGGHSALASVGAEARLDAYRDYCRDLSQLDCGWWAQNEFDLGDVSEQAFNVREADPRITRVIAIDPGMTQAYSSESLASITQPVLLMNLADADAVPKAVDATVVAEHIPNASWVAIPDAQHFSFLGLCIDNAAALLAEEGEVEPICSELGDTPRAALHEQMIEAILAFLRR